MIEQLQREVKQKYPWVKEIQLQSSLPLEETETQTSVPSGAELHLQLVVSSYDLRDNADLLTDLGRWSQHHEVAIKPFILTQEEVKNIQLWDPPDAPEPIALIRYYQKQKDFPRNARQHIERTLSELLRILHGLQQEFPTSGFHSWNVGQSLQLLLTQIVHWGLAVQETEPSDFEQDWTTFVKTYQHHHVALQTKEFAHYPIHLQAFIDRHHTLANLLPRAYGDNDLELEQLLRPLEKVILAIRTEAREKYTTRQERQSQLAKAWWLMTSFSIICIVTLFVASFSNRVQIEASIPLPKGAKPGGMQIYYYKDRKLKKLFRKRTTKDIWAHWYSRPLRGMPKDNYSIRWKGYLRIKHTNMYRICTIFDDGAKMWLNHKLFFSHWQKRSRAKKVCKKRYMKKGWHRLQIELLEFVGHSALKFWIENPKQVHKNPRAKEKRRTFSSKDLCCKNAK